MNAVDMLLRRLRVLIDRTVLHRVGHRGRVRVLQISSRADSPLDEVEHIEPYGFTSQPLAGAEAIVAKPGGNAGRALVLLVNDRRHRIVVGEGEVAIYTHQGDMVQLKSDRSILLKAAGKVRVEAPVAEFTGDLQVSGKVTSQGDQVAAGISQINHRHGGVTSGSGLTGVAQ